ncbi:leucine-rich repeat domain-containing protein, partial [Anabaena sp. CCY 0017]|uniref:leucine-rich repeat domain-containing protein n=1 Tax=Anabaena sp. CCY 0017 TaxID=3103866 RepID=UPI0039C5E6F4
MWLLTGAAFFICKAQICHKYLTTLYLSDNQISILPDAIARLQNLTTLYLSDNQISILPDAI